MASACTATIQNNTTNCLTQRSSEQSDKCSIKSNSSSTLVIEESNSTSRSVSQNHSKKIYRGTAVHRSSNKRYISSSILMPPPGAYPRIPPFPGVPPPIPSPNICFPTIPLPPPPPPPPLPFQELMFSVPPPMFMHQPCLIYQPISESYGYRLMMYVAIGFREDGTYGLLNFIRPNQEYQVSCIYANNIIYYNLPTNIPVANGSSMNIM